MLKDFRKMSKSETNVEKGRIVRVRMRFKSLIIRGIRKSRPEVSIYQRGD